MAAGTDGRAPHTGAHPSARPRPAEGAQRRRRGSGGPDHAGRPSRGGARGRPGRTTARPDHALALRRTGHAGRARRAVARVPGAVDGREVSAVGHAATLVAERKALLARTEFLVREFHPVLPAGTVIRAVTRCRAELLRAGVRRGLPASPRAECARNSAGSARAATPQRPRPWTGLPSAADGVVGRDHAWLTQDCPSARHCRRSARTV